MRRYPPNSRGHKGPWIGIEPWASWLEAYVGLQGGFEAFPRDLLSERLGVPPRRLWGWLQREFDFVRLDIVENALWRLDCIYIEDAFECDVFDIHPRILEKRWRRAEWLRAKLEAEGNYE